MIFINRINLLIYIMLNPLIIQKVVLNLYHKKVDKLPLRKQAVN